MRAAPLLVSVALAACGATELTPLASDAGDEVTVPDAAFAIEPAALPAPPMVNEADIDPAPPTPPAKPVFTPCPPGWVAVTSADFEVCEPWPAGAHSTCPLGHAHFPGQRNCTFLGTACDSADEYATDLPASGVLYVKAGAAPGGDGSRDAPFDSISAALAAVPAAVPAAGTTIALSKGVHRDTIELIGPITLAGACVAQTTLTSSIAGVPMVRAAPGGVVIRNLTLNAQAAPVISADRGAELDVHDVVIAGGEGHAISAPATTLTLRRALIREVDGYGVQLSEGARGTLEQVSLIHMLVIALHASGSGTTLSLSDSMIFDTERGADFAFGRPLDLSQDASATIARSVFEFQRGALIASDRASLIATDLVIREAGTGPDSSDPGAIALFRDSTAQLSRVRLERVQQVGMWIDLGSQASISDSFIAETHPIRSAIFGAGVFAGGGAELIVDRLAVDRASEHGLHVDGAALDARDVCIEDTVPRGDELGIGVLAEDSQIALARASVFGGWSSGLAVRGGTAAVTDLSIREVRGNQVDVAGGIFSDNGAVVTVDRSRIERTDNVGVRIRQANVTIRDAAILDTLYKPGIAATGVRVLEGATLTLERAIIERSPDFGLRVNRGTLFASDVAIRGTWHALQYVVSAFMLVLDGTATLDRVLIEDNVTRGMMVFTGDGENPTLIARDVIVRGQAVDQVSEESSALTVDGYQYSISIERALFERNRYLGADVRSNFMREGVRTLRMEDVTIRDTLPIVAVYPRAIDASRGVVPFFGAGLRIAGNHAELRRVLIEQNTSFGLELTSGSTTTGSDITIRNTGGDGAGFFGRAASFEGGMRAELERMNIDTSIEAGIAAQNGAVAQVRDLVVRGTKQSSCENIAGCIAPRSAAGISVREARLGLTRFSITDSEVCGVQILPGGELDLSLGVVAGNAIGANIQDPAFDVGRLEDRVDYQDNQVRSDVAALPSPPPSELLEEE